MYIYSSFFLFYNFFEKNSEFLVAFFEKNSKTRGIYLTKMKDEHKWGYFSLKSKISPGEILYEVFIGSSCNVLVTC